VKNVNNALSISGMGRNKARGATYILGLFCRRRSLLYKRKRLKSTNKK
jgi:hypothetical protein